MLRFYLQWNGQDYVVMNDTFGNIGKVWRRTQCNNLTTPFIELVMRKTPAGNDMTFIPLNCDFISGTALKAANENNDNEMRLRKDVTSDTIDFKYKLQKLIDMKVEYGTEFMEDFDAMLAQMTEKYPVEKIQLKETTKIIG